MAETAFSTEGAAVTPFLFDGEVMVRTIVLDGEPWFVAKDVCTILEIGDTSMAVAGLEADEVRTSSVGTTAGLREMLLVSESGLYALAFKSRKPAAKRLRKWVTSEVLPSIRKTGKYTAPADAAEGTGLKLRKVHEARMIFGERVAQQLWFKLGLDIVPLMVEPSPQCDLFKTEEDKAA